MLTVRDAMKLLSGAESIGISWGASVTNIDPTNELEMDAYGDYIVTHITSGYKENHFELTIAMKPVRAEAKL